ncbi:MAG TPA: nucleotide excision repair endonuclease [Verrucomicrobiae bacterium]|nr:nucleotide excision repair endonuclease [Verrucomicrobiae bacterium]
MAQLLLFPDPRPLVERLGADFFRLAPECPGVYLMRDRSDTVLYVGKAKNLRKRLSNYRVANPERLPRRHLRLLRAVERIELRPCENETAALASESVLLRTLRPRFNRAGTWPGSTRFLAWRVTDGSIELMVGDNAATGWSNHGPMGAGAEQIRSSLARLLWTALQPEPGMAGLPKGWFQGKHFGISYVPFSSDVETSAGCSCLLDRLFSGEPDEFADWILYRTSHWTHLFDLAARDADLQTLTEFAERLRH